MDVDDVYRRFLDDALSLEEAAELLRAHAAASPAEAASLSLESLPAAQREKAARLFDAAMRPILDGYFAGEMGSDDAARLMAPLVRPVGVYALSVDMSSGPGGADAMARLAELVERLADLEGSAPETE
jgi:hypothetical protein